MKKTLFLAIALFSALPCAAQISINSNQFWASAQKLKVENSTEKNVFFQIGTKHVHVGPGGSVVVSVGGGLFQEGRNYDFPVVAHICSVVRHERIPPPSWAASELLGPLAINDEFLSSIPNETMLRERVEALKKHLDESMTLGRKQMKAELDQWFRQMKKFGAGPSNLVCEVEETPIAVRESWSGWYNYREIRLLILRRDPRRGYYLSSQ